MEEWHNQKFLEVLEPFFKKVLTRRRHILLFFLFFLTVILALQGQNRDYTQWWLYNHGDYAKGAGKNDPRVKWAFGVFERVKNVADKAEGRLPRLFVVNKTLENDALELPDGGIIISPRTLEICYDGVGRELGDSRLAFILGHELAHLANKDYSQHEAFMNLQKYGEGKKRGELAGDIKMPEGRAKEVLADQKGALIASMAGYAVDTLVDEKDNFLLYWARQTGISDSVGDSQHPGMQKRAEFIRTQLKAVSRQMELFRAGVLLFQVGSFHDAAATFIEFSKAYPAREVFNNIGACYLNLALDAIHMKFSEEYYRFRLSTTIDYSTSAETLHPRGEGDYLKDKDIAWYLDRALEYFQMAKARDVHDQACRYNLAAASILKKEYAEAMAACDEVLNQDDKDIDALNNKAIAFYYYGQKEGVDTTQKTIQTLETAHQLNLTNSEVLYNLASLKEKRNRLSGAKLFWEKYLSLAATPRDNFYDYAYKKLYGKDLARDANLTGVPRMPDGIKLGEDFDIIEKKWGKDHVETFKIGSQDKDNTDNWSIDLQVMKKDGIRLLVLDNIVELVEKESGPDEMEEMSKVLERYGPPTKIVRHTGGNFYVYKERGFSIKEIVGKACSTIFFERMH